MRDAEWKPIDTVPRNTRVLVIDEDFYIEIMCIFADGCFYNDLGERDSMPYTHWMPLPDWPSYNGHLEGRSCVGVKDD